MQDTTLIILGALPWLDPTPLRVGRWSDLVRARPIAGESGALNGSTALVAAWHALTHRVPRVLVADPAKVDTGTLGRMVSDDDPVLVVGDPASSTMVSALQALADAHPDRVFLVDTDAAWPEALATRGARAIRIAPDGDFTPPGTFKARRLSGAAVAAPLILGTVAQLSALTTLRTAPENAHQADGLLHADVRGVVRLARAPRLPSRPPQPRPIASTPRAATGPDAAILAGLERALATRIDAHAFSRRSPADTKSAVERDLLPILTAARSRGDIAGFSLDIAFEGTQLVVDVRVQPPRRVSAVVLRFARLDQEQP